MIKLRRVCRSGAIGDDLREVTNLKSGREAFGSRMELVVKPAVALHCRKVAACTARSRRALGMPALTSKPMRTVPFCTLTIWLPPKLVPLKDTVVLMVVKLNELPRL